MNAIELLKLERGTVYTTDEIADTLGLDRDAVQRELEAEFCNGELEHSQRDRDDADQWALPLLNAVPAVEQAALTELKQQAQSFEDRTKQVYPSCRFAALNIYGPREDWCVWGDFASCIEAVQCAEQWERVFKADDYVLEVVGNYWRASVDI